MAASDNICTDSSFYTRLALSGGVEIVIGGVYDQSTLLLCTFSPACHREDHLKPFLQLGCQKD